MMNAHDVREAPRAVLFDFGGTLVHLDMGVLARHLQCDETHLVAGRNSVTASLDAYLLTCRSSSRRPATLEFLLRSFAALGGVPFSQDALDSLVAENARRSLWRLPHPDSRTILEQISRHARVAVLSNGDGRVAHDLAHLGLETFVEFVIDSKEVGYSKPDPRIFQLALEQWGLPGSAVAYVGDLPAVDVVGSRAAGLRSILLDPDNLFPDCYHGHCIQRIRTLQDLFARLGFEE